jgi:hypothetical protein
VLRAVTGTMWLPSPTCGSRYPGPPPDVLAPPGLDVGVAVLFSSSRRLSCGRSDSERRRIPPLPGERTPLAYAPVVEDNGSRSSSSRGAISSSRCCSQANADHASTSCPPTLSPAWLTAAEQSLGAPANPAVAYAPAAGVLGPGRRQRTGGDPEPRRSPPCWCTGSSVHRALRRPHRHGERGRDHGDARPRRRETFGGRPPNQCADENAGPRVSRLPARLPDFGRSP